MCSPKAYKDDMQSDVEKLRERFGMTQEEVAEVFGLGGRNPVSRWETGRRQPSELAKRILWLLNELPKSEAIKIIERLKAYGTRKTRNVRK